jgi:membrane-associated phospholipid phosphatase
MSHKKSTSRLRFTGKDLFFLILILILGFLTVWSYLYLDQKVFSFLSQHDIVWNRSFWVKTFTYLGKVWTLIWLSFLWFILTGEQRPVLIIFLSLMIAFMMVMPLKVGVGRPRPYEIFKANSETEQENRHHHTSFPSGDTAAVFAVAIVVISFATWPWACLLFAACAGIALFRVTAMAHFPSDVFAGAAVGSLGGGLALQIEQRWLPLESPRFNLRQPIAILGIIMIPVLLRLFEGANELLAFFGSCGLVGIFFFLSIRGLRDFRLIGRKLSIWYWRK